MKYRVTTKEVYSVTYLVEADSESEARELGSEGEGTEVDVQYYSTLDDYGIDNNIEVELDNE